MEVIVFWLAPVILLTVLILLVLQIVRHNNKARLYIIEPLDFLLCDWKVARYEPDNQSIARLFDVLARANLSKGTLLERIITTSASTPKSKPITATIIDQQAIGPLAEQFILSIGTKNQSVIVGPLEQVEEFVESEKLAKYRTLSQKSSSNGYLALVIASAFIHGKAVRVAKHQIEGAVILESALDPKQLDPIHKLDQAMVNFLTVSPSAYAQQIYGQVFPDKTVFSLNAKELETLLPPKFAEADLEKAVVVGGADLIARHQALRVWQRQFDCMVVSRNPEDRDLPITPVTHFG